MAIIHHLHEVFIVSLDVRHALVSLYLALGASSMQISHLDCILVIFIRSRSQIQFRFDVTKVGAALALLKRVLIFNRSQSKR